MAAFSTKGLTVWMEQLPGTSPTGVAVSNVTNSKPAVATVSSTDIASFRAGDLVAMAGTGMSAIDGKSFIAGTVDAQAYTIALLGSDGSGAAAAATTGTITNKTADLVEFCVGTIEYQQAAAQAISVGTTCNPAATVAGEPQAGTVSVGGFQDYEKEGYLEFLRASDDQLPRDILVRLPATAVPSGTGAILYPDAVASGRSESFGVNAAAAATGEFTLGDKPQYFK
jgi:hypothetical protein